MELELVLCRPMKEWVRMFKFPLADYTAKYFTDHAEFGNVMSQATMNLARSSPLIFS
jgi:hypothetical protein